MDAILDKALSRDHSRKYYKETLLPALKSASKHVLANNASGGKDPLQILRADVHSLAYLFVLNARCQEANEARALWPCIQQFLQHFDKQQLDIATDMFLAFITTISHHIPPADLLDPLHGALLRWQGREAGVHKLTPVHPLYLRQCSLANAFDRASETLGRHHEPDTALGCTYHTPMLFHLYAAHIYLQLGRYSDALDRLSFVITHPGSSCSTLQICAYKRWVLLHLIVHGKPGTLPKLVSRAAERAFKALAGPGTAYGEVVASFGRNGGKGLRTVGEKWMGVFREDGNENLVRLVRRAGVWAQVRRLGEVYGRLSLENAVDRVVGRQEDGEEYTVRVRKEIEGMVERGDVNARIEGDTLVFEDASKDVQEEELVAQIARIKALNKELGTLEREVGSSKGYLKVVIEGSGHGPGGSGMQMQMKGDVMDLMEEEMMM
ncbi:hypothetical protein YB2330_006237 [Saitoella coloradoensis]